MTTNSLSTDKLAFFMLLEINYLKIIIITVLYFFQGEKVIVTCKEEITREEIFLFICKKTFNKVFDLFWNIKWRILK